MSLLRLLREHGEAVEADLARFYGLQLSALGTRQLTWRRLGVLVRQLPDGAAYHVSRDGPRAAWGPTEELLAIIADRLGFIFWRLSGTLHRKPKASDRPAPITRPAKRGDRARHDLGLSPEALIAQLRANRDRDRARLEAAGLADDDEDLDDEDLDDEPGLDDLESQVEED